MSSPHDLDLSSSDMLADIAEELGHELLLYRDLRYQAGDAASYPLTAFTAELLMMAQLLRCPPTALPQLARNLIQDRRQYLKELRREFDA